MRRLPVMIVLLFVFVGSAAASNEQSQLARGEYLVNGIVACGNCHTPRNADVTANEDMRLAGGFQIAEPEFRAFAPNITQDLDALIVYLRSLPRQPPD